MRPLRGVSRRVIQRVTRVSARRWCRSLELTLGRKNSWRLLLKTLLGAGAVLLLIVCANVANLMLLRATARQKEFEHPVGAGRLGLAGDRSAAAGEPLARWAWGRSGRCIGRADGGVAAVLHSRDAPSRGSQFPAGLAVLAFALSDFTPGRTFVWPGSRRCRSSGTDGPAALRIVDVAPSGMHASHRLRGVLVISEVALALVVLIGASLFLESFQHAKRIDLGIRSFARASGRAGSIAGRIQHRAGQALYAATARSRRSVAGVQAVSFGHAPLGFDRDNSASVQVDGYLPRAART